MSIIQNIRTRYAKVAGAIIALALVGFILMDAMSGPGASLFGQDTHVAKVEGHKVEGKEYQQRLADYETLYVLFSKGQTQLTDETRAQIRQQVLQDMVFEKLIADDVERLGLRVTEAELKEATHGAFPDPLIRQFPYFADPNTGQFNPAYVKAFEEQVPKIQDAQQREKLMGEWEALQRYIAQARLIQKYNALFMGAAYTPQALLTRATEDMSTMASVRYVKIPYSSIPDAQVPVTDAELREYMEKHRARYTVNDPTRSIEYAAFEVLPSGEDTTASLGTLTSLRGEFGTTPESGIETFVNRNSDVRYTGAFMKKKDFPSLMADSVMGAPVGTVVGPYFENGGYQMVRVVARKELPDSVTVRHILVETEKGGQPTRDTVAAKARLDSAIAAINAGVPFDSVVTRFSDDQGSLTTGGKYDFALEQRPGISKEFGDFAFEEGTTGGKKTVRVSNAQYGGYHYIEILSQKSFSPASQLAVVRKDLQPSSTTNDATYSRATQFSGENKSGKAFEQAVAKAGLQRRVAENIRMADFSITGLGPARDIVRWAWNSKVGDVSDPFQLDGRFVVARVSGTRDAGLAALDATLRPQVEAAVKAQKKADMIVKQYKGVASLDAVSATSKQPIMPADSFNLSSPMAPGIGFEPKVVGYAFYNGLKPGAVSPAIKGTDGVFFIQLVSRFKSAVSPDPMQLSQQRMQLDMQARNAVANALQEAVRKGASIRYNTDGLL